jgi:polyvinyl alcohol dehydrogenase (cytochrome)
MRILQCCAASSCVLGLVFTCLLSAQEGATLYKNSCARCHDAHAERVPSRETLGLMSPERVLAAMESGAMVQMASRLSAAERRAIAEFITGKTLGQAAQSPQGMCTVAASNLADPTTEPQWVGWGANLTNSRFQETVSAGLTAAEVPRLKLKWAFGFPGDVAAAAQPTIAAGRVFVGSQGGRVYSLSMATGCISWWFDASAMVRTAITIARIDTESGPKFAAYFGDASGAVYALEAASGKTLWKIKADLHPAAKITGSPTFYAGRLYVPVASREEGLAMAQDYECCSFRGSVVALDGATGKQIWKTYTINEEPRPTTKNKIGTQLWGPSGAGIWSTPTVDTKRKVLYVTTGNNYSDPPTTTSDAFLAMDLETGKILWSRQITAFDAYTIACRMPDKANCPDRYGPDFDFGSPPILVSFPNGDRALVAGQKSGIVHAIDPDHNGKVIWQVRIGKGGVVGGIEWGSAADQSNVYVALSDIARIDAHGTGVPERGPALEDADPKQGGGMFALNLQTGERIWYTPPQACGDRKGCSPAQSAAVSAIPGAAFSGSVDGYLRAYSMKDGAILWDADTVGPYKTVNGVEARGGSLDVAGPAIGGGMLFVNSGYALWGGIPGNVLLAFSVDGK